MNVKNKMVNETLKKNDQLERETISEMADYLEFYVTFFRDNKYFHEFLSEHERRCTQ